MDINSLITQIKERSDFHKAGMILCHNGVVRQTSRDGRRVTGLRVAVDREQLEHVIREHKKRPGIIDIRIEIAGDTDLRVGDDVMVIVVTGDIRDHVISTLEDTLNAVKTTVTTKTEFFEEP